MTGVQSVERALALLREIGRSPGGLVDLAERTDLATSTAARLLGTLEAEGAVCRDVTGIYLIGPDLVAMAGPRSGSDIVSLARRHMAALAETLGEAVALSVPSGTTTTTIEQVDAPKPVRAEDWTGTTVPVHAGCVGLVTMAFWDAQDVDSYLANELEACTDKTVIDPVIVRSRLQKIRLGELLWTHGEYVEGISSVAAPIRNELGHAVASLYAYGPSYRFPTPGQASASSASGIAVAVANGAAALSNDLGWVESTSTSTTYNRGAA